MAGDVERLEGGIYERIAALEAAAPERMTTLEAGPDAWAPEKTAEPTQFERDLDL